MSGVTFGHNYTRPFYYRGIEWTLTDLNLSYEDARVIIDDYLQAKDQNRGYKNLLKK